MSYYSATSNGEVREHSYFASSSSSSSSSADRNSTNGYNRNGSSSCYGKATTSRYHFNSNYIANSGEKRVTLPYNSSAASSRNNSPLSDDGNKNVSSESKNLLNSTVRFVPAKRPFEGDSSKELISKRAKYVWVTGKNNSESPSSLSPSSIPVQNGGIRAYPSSNGTSKLLNGNGVTTASADVGASTGVINNNSSIPQPEFSLFPADCVRLQWDSRLHGGSTKHVGLNNMGNTCFLNSVLQVLSNTAPLVNYLISENHDIKKCPGSRNQICALCSMRDHVVSVLSARNDSLSPAIADRIRCFMKTHTMGRQEDAHEFLRYFVDAMQTAALFPYRDEKLDLFTKETTVVSRIFGGYHKNEIICNNCRSSSVTYDPFLDLNVEIKQSTHLENALSHFTSVETLAGDNAYMCPKCNRRVSAKKIFNIFQPPNILTIQLKRFDHFGKVDRMIQYPERLNLRPYMTEKQGPAISYKLYGVIMHIGRTTHSGHYYAYVRNPDDRWFLMDDSRISNITVEQALRAQAAYVLFYCRVPTPVASVKPQAKPNLGFIGPQRPNSSPVIVPQTKTADSVPVKVSSPKSWFVPIATPPPSSKLVSSIPVRAIGPMAPVVNRPTPLPNVDARPGPIKFRVNNNGKLRLVNAANGSVLKIQTSPTTTKLATSSSLDVKSPIQDSSVSSSTKLVPYEDSDEDEIKSAV